MIIPRLTSKGFRTELEAMAKRDEIPDYLAEAISKIVERSCFCRHHAVSELPVLDTKLELVIRYKLSNGRFFIDDKPFQLMELRHKITGKGSRLGMMFVEDDVFTAHPI